MYSGGNNNDEFIAYSSFANHGGYSGYNAISTANISYETNSKDPVLLRARVFVGNISPKVGRDEIIQLFRAYGTLLGVTVFKGYAFVQFSHGSEADLAVSALNGYNWINNILDVKLAISGQQPQSYPKQPSSNLATTVANTAKGMGKRNQNQFTPAASNNQKRAKVDHGPGGGQKQQYQQQQLQEKANKAYAAHFSNSELANIQQHDSHDTLICGGCRYVTTNLADFVQHRKHPCKLSSKPDGEPDALICGSCDDNEQYASSWALLTHIQAAHNGMLYKEVHLPRAPTKSTTTATAIADGVNGANDSGGSVGVGGETVDDQLVVGQGNGDNGEQHKCELDVSMEQK